MEICKTSDYIENIFEAHVNYTILEVKFTLIIK